MRKEATKQTSQEANDDDARNDDDDLEAARRWRELVVVTAGHVSDEHRRIA